MHAACEFSYNARLVPNSGPRLAKDYPMHGRLALGVTRLWAVVCVITIAGCAATFSPGNAREVSRERLLQICEAGKTDHLIYRGSDFNYHYVFDSRPGKERTYKVRATDMKLANTFSLGEDSYVLLPWVIEGELLGARPKELETGDLETRELEVQSTDKSEEVDDVDDGNRTGDPSRVGGAAQPIVERPAQADFRENVGDDQVKSGRVESP